MGKPPEEEVSLSLPLPSIPESSRWGFCRFLSLKCFFMVILAVSVMLSAVFWLPPFFNGSDRLDLDLNSTFKNYEVVATFTLEKPISLLKDNISKLEDDVFDEIEAPTIKVKILSLIPAINSNVTKVVFAIVPYNRKLKISETGLSLIRSNFVSLVIRQYSLRLTPSLFGNPFSFEVLKFSGGITIIPQQGVFLLQKVQVLFNFTLNSSINETQEHFHVLTSQLKSGLHLASYENLYIKLTNPKGSTVAIPTTVQSAIVLAIGNTPSQARLKQLAQTIENSHAKNLGLNNTVFGKVKQVRLSSILQHSLGNTGSPTPAPSPLPHHHHHHHHHHSEANPVPTVTPPVPSPAYNFHFPKMGKASPSPAPVPSHMGAYKAHPPGCRFGHTGRPRKGNKSYYFFPPVEPPEYPELAPSPLQQINQPVPTSSPTPAIPHRLRSHVQPPAQSEPDTSPFQMIPSLSPSPSSSSAGPILSPSLLEIPKLLVLMLLLLC